MDVSPNPDMVTGLFSDVNDFQLFKKADTDPVELANWDVCKELQEMDKASPSRLYVSTLRVAICPDRPLVRSLFADPSGDQLSPKRSNYCLS